MNDSLRKRVSAGFALPALVLLLLAGCRGGPEPGTITVSGSGTVRVQPDLLRLELTLRHTAESTGEAQARVADMVARALEILREAGVQDRNVRTAGLRFSPEYEWGQAGRRLLGQMAEQSISFSIENIDADASVASALVDRLTGINGIELQGMNFAVSDTDLPGERARELAFRQAREKADQFAALAGLRVVKVVGIFEEGRTLPTPMPAVQARNGAMFSEDSGAGTAIPAGEMEISARIVVQFAMR